MNNDLISREALLHEIGKLSLDWEYGLGVKDCLDLIDNAPTVEVGYLTNCANCEHVEKIRAKYRSQGEWKPNSFQFECNLCENLNAYKSNFCPNCGADMRKGGAV